MIDYSTGVFPRMLGSARSVGRPPRKPDGSSTATAMHSTTPPRADRSRSAGFPFGAAVARVGSLTMPGHASAVPSSLPAWTGEPDTAPAALAARTPRRCCAATSSRVGRPPDSGLPPALAGRLSDPVPCRPGPRFPTPARRPFRRARPAAGWRVSGPCRWGVAAATVTPAIRRGRLLSG